MDNKMINLLGSVMLMLPETIIKKVADGMLDTIENAVKGSGNKLDDIIVLPLCANIRKAFLIADNDTSDK